MADERETMLRTNRAEASQKLHERISKGEELLEKQILSEQDLKQFHNKSRAWLDYNRELLKSIFSTDEVWKEYCRTDYAHTDFDVFADQTERETDELRDEIREKLPRLHSIVARLELIPEIHSTGTAISSAQKKINASLQQDLKLLIRQASELRERVIKINPEAADRPGRPGSGITEAITPYNSYLDRAKRVFHGEDAPAVMAINHIPRQEEIQERLAASYHKTAQFRILNGLSDLLAILESRTAEPTLMKVFDLKTFHPEIYLKCQPLYAQRGLC